MIFKNPPHWLQEIPVKIKDNNYNVIILPQIYPLFLTLPLPSQLLGFAEPIAINKIDLMQITLQSLFQLLYMHYLM